LSKVDCVTVWLLGANWNWTISPTLATTLSGEKARVPLEPPTLTTCTTVPAPEAAVDEVADVLALVTALVPVPVLPALAVEEEDAASALAMLMAARVRIVNCILTVLKILISK